MKLRTSLWLLPLAIGWAGAAEPKPRPRLEPPPAIATPQEAAPAMSSTAAATSFRSFDEFLQADARRPVGLEVYREPRAPRTETAGAPKPGLAGGDTPPKPAPADAANGDILVLPKLEVIAEPASKLGETLAALEANQSWESSSAAAWDKPTVVDAILNPSFLKLGGYSGAGRAATARHRVELLNWVRILRISQAEAKTPAEKARIQADIDGITGIMRMWQ